LFITADYLVIEALIFAEIEDSTCPSTTDELREDHWDYRIDQEDCAWFPRERNPKPLGSRLLRHAFHDAAGIMDGHVDLDHTGNDGLQSSLHVLKKLYNYDAGMVSLTDGFAISEVLNMADFCVWTYIAAYRYACFMQDGRAEEQGTELGCDMPISFGRWTYDETDETHWEPSEDFPDMDGAATSQILEDYFAEHFGFDAIEVVTIMGAHTLGGARKTESGYAGMWTQSKNQFNNEYYTNMIDPIAMECEAAKGENVEVGADACYLLEGDLCEVNSTDPEFTGRCQGWELLTMPFQEDNSGVRTYKFQWRHSCNEDQSACHHLMMHVDMTLFKDIDKFVCTTDDVDTGARECENEGQIIGWPDDSPCGEWAATKRIFAKCYKDKTDHIKSTVELYASSNETFHEAFVVVYSTMLKLRNPVGWPALRYITIPEEEVVQLTPSADPCPDSCPDPMDGTNPFECVACEKGLCGKNAGGSYVCKREGWTAPTSPASGTGLKSIGEDCLSCWVGYSGQDNPIECTDCESGKCGEVTTPKGTTKQVCKPQNWLSE
jgi:hypothetical protein